MSLNCILRLYGSLGSKIETLFRVIPTLEADDRSSLIKCAQAQSLPHPNNSPGLWELTRRLFSPSREIPVYTSANHVSNVPMSTILSSIVDDHLYSGLVLDLARSLPMSEPMIESLQLGSWFKEITAIEGVRPGGHVDFSPIFDPNRFDIPLHPCLPSNRAMCEHWFTNLVQWRQWASRTTHYPRANNKFMSHETRTEYTNLTGDLTEGFSQRDYLAFEARTGIRLGGCVEMRQRWYRSQMKPRTYYAQGGIYGFTSCLQDLFSNLVNCSPITHHVSRLRPSRLYAHPGQYFRIYDLTSFTSLMWSQRDFLYELAEFCRGFAITMMTAGEGLICRDLGVLLHEYNDLANNFCPVTYARCPFLDVHSSSYQHVAGMLGVFGNLMTCTLPHGVIMSMHCVDENQINVAGDDGILPEYEDVEVAIREAINLVGVHEPTKEFITRHAGCIHLKRPIYQFANRLFQRPMIIWPNVSLIAETLLGIEDPRYRQFDDETSTSDKITMAGREILRFLRSIFLSEFLTDDHLSVAGDFISKLTDAFERRYQVGLRSGRLTQCGDPFFWPSVPCGVEDCKRDPWIATVHSRFDGYAVCQLNVPIDWDQEIERLEVGMSIECNPCKQLSFLVNCKYMEVEPVMTRLVGVDALERLEKIPYDPDMRPVNRYTVVDVIPVKFHCF